jgi:hypothetical protein
MSQKSLQLATQEQAALTEQQKKVEASRAAVVAAQQQLAQAQAQEQQERTKATQLEQQMSAHLNEGVKQAQQAQTSAGMGAEGMQTVAGTVTHTSPSQLVLQTPAGRTMSFNVDGNTKVLLGSEARSVSDIQRGADAQVAYDPKAAGQMTALIIRVLPAGASTGRPAGGASQSGGGGSQPAQRAVPPPQH